LETIRNGPCAHKYLSLHLQTSAERKADINILNGNPAHAALFTSRG
jgi:hypothetical protein